MGTQNLNNYYFNRLDVKLNYSSYYDFFLSSDEKDFNREVVYSNNLIGYDNGNVLPVLIDLSQSGCSTQPTISCDVQSGTPQVILSKNYWSESTSTCDCPYTGTSSNNSAYTIYNINLTGIDNGLFTGMTSGETIELHSTIPIGDTFSPTKYDKRLKLHQVTASTYSPNNISYSISSTTDSSGYYQELNGGFYQGFYKLYGYPYEILPDRPTCGWTMETLLKIRTSGNTSGNCFTTLENNCESTQTLNDVYPNNSGFFYYVGTRAENKFWAAFSSETGCTSFSGYCSETGNSGDSCTINVSSGVTGYSNTYELDCCNNPIESHPLGPVSLNINTGTTPCGQSYSPFTLPVSAITDTYSNSFGVRLTPDFRLGYRTLRFTGSCVTTGTSIDCNTGGTFNCGYAIEEYYTDVICPSIINSGTCENTWLSVSVTFERDFCLSGCNVQNEGGLYDLLKVPTVYRYQRYASDDIVRCKNTYPLIPEDGYYDLECSGSSNGNISMTSNTTYGKWLNQKYLRQGTLTFYVNGRRVGKVENFEEIIPRPLNTHRDLQVGVPYNISWGGGSQGLYENMTYGTSGCSQNPPYQQDPNDLGLLIQENFAGSWLGGISQFRYYIKPLQSDEIYHNFLVNKDRYSLIDCQFTKNCTSKGCNSPQTLYLRDGDSLDIKIIFGTNSDNVYTNTNGNNVRIKSIQQDNISSVTIKKNDNVVNTPFNVYSDDTLEVIITKMDSDLNSNVTLISNLIK